MRSPRWWALGAATTGKCRSASVSFIGLVLYVCNLYEPTAHLRW